MLVILRVAVVSGITSLHRSMWQVCFSPSL